ncbi:uncharacterized protein [Battus philenor]|uniref:uncharacterized protein n=1 Tax=Battus philenor TaxID=42288 RepID=UPI0035D11F4E
MWKTSIMFPLLALSVQANSQAIYINSLVDVGSEDHPTEDTGNRYIVKHDNKNNYFFIPNLNISSSDPAANTIFIVRPGKHKRPCNDSTISTTAEIPTSPSTPLPPSFKTTIQPTKTTTKLPPRLSTTDNPTTSHQTKEPNTIKPTTIKPNRSTQYPPGYDVLCSYDGLYRANNYTCDQFYVCIYGIQYLMDCPYGQVFNDELKVCDWLENVKDCHPPAFEDFVCPDEGYGLDEDLILNFRYRDSCIQYVACHKRMPRLLICDEGQSFDDKSGTCVQFKSPSNCRNVRYSY